MAPNICSSLPELALWASVIARRRYATAAYGDPTSQKVLSRKSCPCRCCDWRVRANVWRFVILLNVNSRLAGEKVKPLTRRDRSAVLVAAHSVPFPGICCFAPTFVPRCRNWRFALQSSRAVAMPPPHTAIPPLKRYFLANPVPVAAAIGASEQMFGVS